MTRVCRSRLPRAHATAAFDAVGRIAIDQLQVQRANVFDHPRYAEVLRREGATLVLQNAARGLELNSEAAEPAPERVDLRGGS